MQISTYLYNGYLLFSSTFITQEENDNSEDYSTNYFSLFMIFGYVNGTDRIENIYNYLSNHETFEEENVFFNLLTQNRKIENYTKTKGRCGKSRNEKTSCREES